LLKLAINDTQKLVGKERLWLKLNVMSVVVVARLNAIARAVWEKVQRMKIVLLVVEKVSIIALSVMELAK